MGPRSRRAACASICGSAAGKERRRRAAASRRTACSSRPSITWPEKMPPKSKLKPEEIADLTDWVKMGAPWPGTAKVAGVIDIEHEKKTYWAFQPIAAGRRRSEDRGLGQHRHRSLHPGEAGGEGPAAGRRRPTGAR